MRLDKFLADMGVDPRGKIKHYIKWGKVTVNGKGVTDPGFQIRDQDMDSVQVSYKGHPVVYARYEYYMMHKPAGVLSATEDKKQITVLDLMTGPVRKDVFPVGRLDKDTEGLLLLTNDGELAHRLLSPKHHIDKVYLARVGGELPPESVEAFLQGIQYDTKLTAMPAGLTIIRTGLPMSETEKAAYIKNYELLSGIKKDASHANASCLDISQIPDTVSEVTATIQEGKFHQIKKMFHALGTEVVYLKRVSMGPLQLDPTLMPGQYRPLTEAELAALREITG
jgi:16S rRNA pseudouridine516 synthase